MNDKEYKKTNKLAACTENPIKNLIPFEIRKETLLKIKNECIDIYGSDIMAECPKRLVCFGKSCIGRPLAWDSPTARPYLDQMALNQTIIDGELFIETNCSSCPIFNSCASLCPQIEDFIRRDETKEVNLVYRQIIPETDTTFEDNLLDLIRTDKNEIPWDVLPEHKQQIIKKYIYEQRDFITVAKSLGILNQARAKYYFYAALNKLSEWAAMRAFIISEQEQLSEQQYNILNEIYFNNKKQIEVSKRYNLSKQYISKVILDIVDKNKIKWYTFVRKEGTKIVYNVPEVLK